MKIQISSEGLRVRLTYRELEQVVRLPVVLECGGFSVTLQVEDVAHSVIEGWAGDTFLRLSRKDFADLQAEPENGIVLADIIPRVVVEVDKRDRG